MTRWCSPAPARWCARPRCRWTARPTDLKVRLRGGGPAPAGLRLSWARVEDRDDLEKARFEPIPENALRHERTADLTAGLSARAGRELYLEHRCGQCHLSEAQRRQSPELAARGPDLLGIGSRLDWRWVREWVLNPRGVRASARMPALCTALRPATTPRRSPPTWPA